MADTRTKTQRSAIMRSVQSKNTGPELVVRRFLHRLGFRFRLHVKNLPGRPDIVLSKHRTAIFVHGCFWHAHGCKIGQPPKSRPEFWEPKLRRNRERDAANEIALARLGWNVLTVWQCETQRPEEMKAKLAALLSPQSKNSIDSTKPER
ncbi:MAG: very short patch repair endonuclease [Chloroflexota bacterium]